MVIIIMGMITAISLALLQMVGSENVLSTREIRQQQIAQIAEAGVNYYRWHLAHYPTDYKDGQTGAGPYVHDFKDTTGKVIGRYELTITAPPTGSTITTVHSSGYLLTYPNARHTITARLGIPSLSQYAVVANAFMRFGTGTETFGPIMGNSGIHFDGVAHGLVSSAQTTYSDPDGYGTKPGVWSLNSDATTFLGGKQFPVSAIDFAGITVDLSHLQTAAQASGIYLTPSTKLGYHLVLRTDGKVDMYIVNTQLQCQYKTTTTGYCSLHASTSCTSNTDCTGRCSNNNATSCTADVQCGGHCSVQTGTSCTNNNLCGGYCSGKISQSCSGNTCGSKGPCIQNGQTCVATNTCQPQVCVFNWKDYGYCSNDYNTPCTEDTTCGSGNTCMIADHSIGTGSGDQASFSYNGGSSLGVTLPPNGIIFASDDVWVDGQINNSRVTIVAAKDPLASGRANIYLTHNLTYTNYDGRDVVGLIAQNDILASYFSDDTLEVDAAMIAQNGRVGRPFFGSTFTSSTSDANFQIVPVGETNPDGTSSCQQYRKRTTLTLDGSMATNQRYGFAWIGSNLFSCGTDHNDSGYCDRNLLFDTNLIYSPPPLFPTSGQYSVISFTEQ